VDPALLLPKPTGIVDVCEENMVTVYFGPFHVDEDWAPGVVVLAWACDQAEPLPCFIAVGPPPPGPSTTTLYDVNYTANVEIDPDGIPGNGDEYVIPVDEDSVWKYHLVEFVDAIPDLLTECDVLDPPTGAAVHVSVNTLQDPDGTPGSGDEWYPTRYVSAMGMTLDMTTELLEVYASQTNGEAMYMYNEGHTLGGTIAMKLAMVYDDYTLTSGAGTNIGQPYTAGSTWTYDTHAESWIGMPPPLGGCQDIMDTSDVTVTVTGPGLTDPTGNYTNCYKIVTDDPLVAGDTTAYYSVPDGVMVYQVGDEQFIGTETRILQSYTPVVPDCPPCPMCP
jgi:hypothetical protein